MFLDKGFCSKPVFKVLEQHKLSFVTRIPVRGKSGGVRLLFQGKSRKTTYTFNSPTYGRYIVEAVVVKRYSKGRYGRHQTKWFAYAVTGLPTNILPAQVFELYRQRFGIESSYRQMNQVRARTSTRNPVIRLLLVGLAFVFCSIFTFLCAKTYPLRSNSRCDCPSAFGYLYAVLLSCSVVPLCACGR
jgi:putative transposase